MIKKRETMWMLNWCGVVMFAAAATGCGEVSSTATDAGVEPSPDATRDAEPTNCTLSADYGDLGLVSEEEIGTGSLENIELDNGSIHTELTLSVALPSGNEDFLIISIKDGFGDFVDGVPIGETEILGTQTKLAECSACVLVLDDFESSLRALLAQGGALTINNIVTDGESPRVSGSISNIVLAELDKTTENAPLVEGGCETEIGALAFNVALERVE